MEQLEPCGPSLGAPRERRELLRGQRLAVEITVELLHLPRPESEVVDPDLEQLARDLEAGYVHVRPYPAGGHDGQGRWRELDESLEGSLGVGRPEGVQVVDDEQSALRHALLECGDRILDRLPAAAQHRDRGAQRLLQVAEHAHGVSVPTVGAVPRHRPWDRRCETREQGRLAGSGRRDDQRQAMLPCPGERGIEARDGQRP